MRISTMFFMLVAVVHLKDIMKDDNRAIDLDSSSRPSSFYTKCQHRISCQVK